jgi:hypothetical protein
VLAFKWTGILIAAVTVALDGMANLIITILTPFDVPSAINTLAVGVAVVGALVAFAAHLQHRTERNLDHLVDLLLTRIDELEARIGDRNSGFVEGYLLRTDGDAPDAPVLPLTPRLPRRAVTSVDD